MNQFYSLLKESRFIQWIQTPVKGTSLFSESRIFLVLSRICSFFAPANIAGKTLPAAKWLLASLLFFCLFSPRFYLASTHFSRIDFRMEDLFLLVIAFFVFQKSVARNLADGIPGVEKAFLWFLIAAQISILNGFLFRTIDKPLLSVLYLVKWFEYFLVFFVTAQLVRTPEDFSFFFRAFFILGMVVAAYGYWEHFFPQAKAVYPNYYRLYERPPFHGDANHIGGFFILWIGFFTGLFLKTKSRMKQALLFLSILFAFFPFLWTYSRKSYFALAGAFLFSFFIPASRRRLLGLISVLILLGLLLPTRAAERLLDLGEVFASADPFHSSWAGNWVLWKQAFWNFGQFFLFGSGLGSRHRLFYESQYVLVLAETGLVGFTAFCFLLLTLVREPLTRTLSLKGRGKGEGKAIAFGWLISFSGILIHSISCVSFTVVKIAIPFWFLTALTLIDLKQNADGH